MVVQLSGGEGGQGLTVQGVGGGGSGFDDVAFVKLEFYLSGYILLGGFHESLNSFPEGSEPFSLIYDLGHLVAHILLGLHGGSV